MTLENTPHGPEKSITLTPSEMTSATRIGRSAGGVSLYFSAANPLTSEVFDSLGAEMARGAGKAAAAPRVAAAVRNLRLFIVCFCWWMGLKKNASISAKRRYRVHHCRAPRRHQACDHGDREQQKSDKQKRERVCR